jgi:hypothetical protein
MRYRKAGGKNLLFLIRFFGRLKNVFPQNDFRDSLFGGRTSLQKNTLGGSNATPLLKLVAGF